MGELETKQEFVTPLLEYPKTAEDWRLVYQQMVRSTQNNDHDNLMQENKAGSQGNCGKEWWWWQVRNTWRATYRIRQQNFKGWLW